MPEETVRVLVRCRPFNKREKDLNCQGVIEMSPEVGKVSITKPADGASKSFTFDAAYNMDSNSQAIYEEMAFPLVEGVLQGFNGTVFAYGQTGCGKSFTMEGIPDPLHRGITPRSFEHIFQEVSVRENTKFLIRASYIEIYNEQVRDLLSNSPASLDLREDPDKGVYVAGLSTHDTRSTAGMLQLMAKGTAARATGATAMNAQSSRSHSIFTVYVEMCETREDGTDHIVAGKLNLVDLAGSERQSKTQASGARLKEATKINLSLSALGNVISALVDGKAKHIPYRDSKLTRLLQDSLGGNTKTLMIAAISPADNNYDETLSTLRYANRAKNIKNKATINEDPKDAMLRQYQEEIERLKAMLAGQLGGPVDPSMYASGTGAPSAGVQNNHALEEEKKRLKEEKERELQEIENRLKEDYESQLAAIKSKFSTSGSDNAALEQEFATITQQYEETRARAQEEVLSGVDNVGTIDPLQEQEWRKERAEWEAHRAQHEAAKQEWERQQKEWQEQRDAEVTAAQRKLQDEYDLKLAELERMSQDDTVDAATIEAQFAKATKEYEESKAAVAEEILQQAPPPPAVVSPGPAPAPPPPASGPATTALGVASAARRQWEQEREAWQQERNAELAKAEAKLQAEYDRKLAELEMMSQDDTVEASVVEAEFAKATEEYEQSKAAVATQIQHAQPPPPPPPVTNTAPSVAKIAAGPEQATPTQPTTSKAVAVIGPDGNPVVSLLGHDGSYIKATIGEDGQLRPILDASSQPVALLGPGGMPAQPLSLDESDRSETPEEMSAPQQVVRFVPTSVIGPDGEITPALIGPDGRAVFAEMNEDGNLEPLTNELGEFVYVESPTGTDAVKAHTADEPIPVVGPNGDIEIAVLQDGLAVAAEVNADGELQPVVDNRGRTKAIVGPNGERAKEVMAIAPIESNGEYMIPKLTAVIGPNGVPVPAVIANNQPVQVRVSSTGQIVPVTGDDGKYIVIVDGSGQHASTVQPASEVQLVAAGPGETPEVVVRTEDGAMTRAELGDGGMAQPALDFGGQPEEVPGTVISAESVAPVTAEVAPNSQSVPPASSTPNAQKVLVVEGVNGEAVPVIVAPDGRRVRAKAKNGKLVAMRDKGGKFVPMPAISETSLDILQPTNEEESTEQLHASAGPPAVMDEEVEAKVQARLAELQQMMVGGEVSDDSQRKQLKEELRLKKLRAERKRLEILKKATDNDETQFFSDLFARQSDKIEENRYKFEKAKELLVQAREEQKDLAAEFEREREALLETIRDQAKQMAFMESVIGKVQPLIRRDCNYSNIDKIRKIAEWDDDSQRWLLPNVVAGHNADVPTLAAGGGVRHRPPPASLSSRESHAADEALRARLPDGSAAGPDPAADDSYAARMRQNDLLGKLTAQQSQMAKMKEAQLARFSNAIPNRQSSRARELAQVGQRSPRSGPRTSQSGRSPKMVQRRGKGYSADEWLQK